MNLTTTPQRVAAACTSVVTTFLLMTGVLSLAHLPQPQQAQVQIAQADLPATR